MMRILHQVSLVILTILFLFLAFNVGIYAFGWVPETYLPFVMEYIYQNIEIGLAAALLFLLGIWLLQSIFVFKPSAQTIVQQTEMGEVRISVSAIRGLVEQVVLEQPGITSVKPRFDINEDYFKVYLTLAVNSDAQIPSLNKEIGDLVKDRLYRMVGLQVEDVKILVEEIASGKKNTGSTIRVR